MRRARSKEQFEKALLRVKDRARYRWMWVLNGEECARGAQSVSVSDTLQNLSYA